MPDPQPPPVPLSEPEVTKLRLDLHRAEYDALTMRITYFITLQYAIYALAGAYLGFAIQARNSMPTGTLIWASLLVLQLLAWAMLQTQGEIFTNVDYLENHVKPKVAALLGDSSFWEYESFLAKRRAKGFTRFEWQYGMFGFFILAIGAASWLVVWAIRQTHWALADTLWASANLYIGVLVVGRIAQNRSQQRHMLAPYAVNAATTQAGQPHNNHPPRTGWRLPHILRRRAP